MKWSSNKKKIFTALSMAAFIFTGTYNAVVINSESTISGDDIKFVKRLDEVYGVSKRGQQFASNVQWQKLKKSEVAHMKTMAIQKSMPSYAPSSSSDSGNTYTAAAIQEELSLTLTEVTNPAKWKDGLKDFSGNLVTNNGIIESLNITLANGESVSIASSEMSGNVFTYDNDYSGMLYQVDQNTYMVNLTNGPLEGTRLKFTADSVAEAGSNQEYVADAPTQEVQDEMDRIPAQVDHSEITQSQQSQVQAQEVQPQEMPSQEYQAQEAQQPTTPEEMAQANPEAAMAHGYEFEQQPTM